MAEQQVPTPQLDASIQWTDKTSKNGVAYRVGVKKTGRSVEENGAAAMKSKAAMKGPSAVTRVYWEPNMDPTAPHPWIDAEPEVKSLGISRYKLYMNTYTKHFQYTLEITNTKGWGFRFFDQSGDFYDLGTVVNGDHYLEYSSDKPVIDGVKQN